MVDMRDVGQAGRIVHFQTFAFFGIYFIRNVGHGGDDVHVEFSVEAFLNDFHVEQAQEAAAETEAQGHRRFGLEGERSIVQLQFFYAAAQVFVVLALDGIDAGKQHGFHFFETGNGLFTRSVHMRDGTVISTEEPTVRFIQVYISSVVLPTSLPSTYTL